MELKKKKKLMEDAKQKRIMLLINKFKELCEDSSQPEEMGGTAKVVHHRPWTDQPNAFARQG